ncbi:dephospho-CoA kinase [Candidatus Woesearchaeota archaeon]|nr:dephospho-CoA kinase [Candidatus Woesearchaeota archaeon]
MTKNIIEEVAREILQREKRPLIVGINGMVASGKTFFTKLLEEELKKQKISVQTIYLDDFRHPLKYRKSLDKSLISYPLQYYDYWFDYQLVRDIFFKRIMNQKYRGFKLEVYNEKTGEYDLIKNYSIDENTIILFDGLFIFREEFEKIIDYKIYIDVDESTSLKRILVRDSTTRNEKLEEIKQKWLERSLPAQKIYLQRLNPRERANMVIDNNEEGNPIITKIRDLK